MSEPRKIYLGTIQVPEPGESIAFDLPADLDPEQITAALEKLEADRAATALAESKKLHQMFLPPEGDDKAEDKP
jgi:hypothetical protein